MTRGLADFIDALGKDPELRGRLETLGADAKRRFAEMAARLGQEKGYSFSAQDLEAVVAVVPEAQSEVKGFALFGLNRGSILINKPFNPQGDPEGRDSLTKVP